MFQRILVLQGRTPGGGLTPPPPEDRKHKDDEINL